MNSILLYYVCDKMHTILLIFYSVYRIIDKCTNIYYYYFVFKLKIGLEKLIT